MVRIHPDPPNLRGCSSAGRAPALQAGGRRFDPDQLHHAQMPDVRSQMSVAPVAPCWLLKSDARCQMPDVSRARRAVLASEI